MSGNWGIKADDGYVNFIHGTIDKVCDFETSSSIDDVCIFSEMVAKGYAQALNATAFRINISEQSQLTIPKIVIEYYESGDNLYLSWLYANDMLKVNDEQALKKREDEIIRRKAILQAYLAGKALGVELVKVVEG